MMMKRVTKLQIVCLKMKNMKPWTRITVVLLFAKLLMKTKRNSEKQKRGLFSEMHQSHRLALPYQQLLLHQNKTAQKVIHFFAINLKRQTTFNDH